MSVSARHTAEDIDDVVSALEAIGARYGILGCTQAQVQEIGRHLPARAAGQFGMSALRTHSFWTAAFWRVYWVTLRFYFFFVSGASGLVGLAVVGDVPAVVLVLAFLAFFFSYGLG
jgi:hypothetical protein